MLQKSSMGNMLHIHCTNRATFCIQLLHPLQLVLTLVKDYRPTSTIHTAVEALTLCSSYLIAVHLLVRFGNQLVTLDHLWSLEVAFVDCIPLGK